MTIYYPHSQKKKEKEKIFTPQKIIEKKKHSLLKK